MDYLDSSYYCNLEMELYIVDVNQTTNFLDSMPMQHYFFSHS